MSVYIMSGSGNLILKATSIELDHKAIKEMPYRILVNNCTVAIYDNEESAKQTMNYIFDCIENGAKIIKL